MGGKTQSRQSVSTIVLHNLLLFSVLALPVSSTTVGVSTYRPFPKGSPTGRGDERLVQLRMNGAVPKDKKLILCEGFTIKKGDEFWIKQFRAEFSSEVSYHHISMNGCNFIPTDPCHCPERNRSMLYSWVRHTPPHRLPPDVGFRIGGNSDVQFIILNIHYGKILQNVGDKDYSGVDLHITREKQKYIAGHYSPMALGTIPPHKKEYSLEACITVDRKVPFHIFSYQPHGHFIANLISSYRLSKRTGEMAELGRGKPPFPEAYFVESRITEVEPGDTIMLRCIYDSSNLTDPTNTMGMPKNAPGAPLEMCVMHLLYYADPSINTKSYYIRGQCTEKQLASFPKNSREQLPSNSLLDEHAKKGNQKGIIRINENISMNMELEDFESLFGPYAEKNKIASGKLHD